MSLGSEFKEFAMKGNVVDMAVGVIVGAAFGKIVSSLVGDVIMPALGKLIGGINFSDLAVQIAVDHAGKPVLLKYGSFLQTIFEFLVIALSIFAVIKGINKLKRPPPSAATLGDIASTRIKTDVTADLAVGWHLHQPPPYAKQATISVKIANITNNRQISDFAGYQSVGSADTFWRNPGISAFVNLDAKF